MCIAGDSEYKPCVIAIPDIRKIDLNGDEDFLILACDGLWDFVSEEEAARTVYRLVLENPGKFSIYYLLFIYLLLLLCYKTELFLPPVGRI